MKQHGGRRISYLHVLLYNHAYSWFNFEMLGYVFRSDEWCFNALISEMEGGDPS